MLGTFGWVFHRLHFSAGPMAAGGRHCLRAMVESLFAMAFVGGGDGAAVWHAHLWLGLLRIAEKAGIVDAGAWLSPLFARLMPEVPRWPPGPGPDDVELCGQCPGLDNAATPMGLKAMRAARAEPQARHRHQRADPVPGAQRIVTDTLLPVTIFAYRQAGGRTHAGFLPILLATSASTWPGCWRGRGAAVAAVAPGGAGSPAAGGAGAGWFMALLTTLSAARWRSCRRCCWAT